MPFITVIDTFFNGRVAGWNDDSGRPCIYETRAEAEIDAADVPEDVEPDEVIEVVVTDSKIYDPIDGRVYWEKGL